MCIIFQALQSHKRCSDYHLTLTVQRCPSLLWHRSTSLLVRHSPPMVVAHQFCPPLARPARWLPPARRLQRMDGKRATVRPSVHPYGRILPILGIFKTKSSSILKMLQIKWKRLPANVLLSVCGPASSYLPPTHSIFRAISIQWKLLFQIMTHKSRQQVEMNR